MVTGGNTGVGKETVKARLFQITPARAGHFRGALKLANIGASES